jgi:hypothetical protein
LRVTFISSVTRKNQVIEYNTQKVFHINHFIISSNVGH